MGSAERVDGVAWRSARETALSRDGYCCVDCGADVRAELDVHHRIPRSAGGTDGPGNLVTLCDGCHAVRHPNLQVSLSRQVIERWALRVARWLDLQGEFPESTAALSAALRLFGKDRLREGQLDAVLAALRGEDVLVVRPTGSGKTLCFQLPAVMRSGTTFVISPLKALMKDQVAVLQSQKLPGTFINGDLGPDEKRLRYDLLDKGAWKFLYCAPERFGLKVRAAEAARIKTARPTFLVVDEAHCIDRWGDDFRPDYSRIREIRRDLGDPPLLAFTATAGAAMQDRILESLGCPEARRLVTGADRPNIALIRHHLPYDARRTEPEKERVQMAVRAELIAHLIRQLPDGKAMVFVPTVRIGERLQAALAAGGVELPFFHANLGTANQRDLIVGRFTGRLEPELRAVICTNAFGMGIDVPDVRLVINWQHPASVEDYLQEFGRAGRDGKPAVAVVLTSGGQDASLLRWMADKSIDAALTEGRLDAKRAQERKDAKRARIDAVHRLVTDRGRCFRRLLLTELGATTDRTRRSLARRLIERVFSEQRRVAKASFCCDYCNDADAARYIGSSAP